MGLSRGDGGKNMSVKDKNMYDKKVAGKMISRMARQSLKSSRTRNIFVMITITLASALLTGILTFAVGRQEQTRRELTHRQQVGYFELTEGQVNALQADERISYQIQVKSGVLSEMEGFAVMPRYVSNMTDEILVGNLISGVLPERDDEVAVCGAMLCKMGVEPQVGSSVTFRFYDGNVETFTVSGILEGDDTAKQFPVFLSQGYAERGSQLADRPYETYAKLQNAARMSAGDCRELMYQIGRDAGVERKYVNPSKAFLDSLSPDPHMLTLCALVGAVILLAAALVIYGVFYLSVIGRIHQFGQLCAIGMTRRQMQRLVSREGGILFLRAAPVGILPGAAVGYGLTPKGFDAIGMTVAVLAVLAVIYGITMISVGRPARIAAAVSPMEALRYMPQHEMKRSGGRKLCRSLSPLGLGMMNFSKNKRKAAITMFSLALGGILFMTAATYMSSFRRENYARQGYFTNAEFHINYTQAAVELSEYGVSGLQAGRPLGGELADTVSALEGVKEVEEIRQLGVRFDFPMRDEYDVDDMVYLIKEEEIEGIGQYLEEGSADLNMLMSGDYVLMAGNGVAQEVYGWQFRPGDSLTFRYFDGNRTAEKDVKILGILSEQFVVDQNGRMEGWFLIPEQVALGMVNFDGLDTDLLVSVEEALEPEVAEALEQMLEERPELGLETLAERQVAYGRQADRMFGAISGLAIFIMMFSILSMMNTLITNIVTRRQELAMLESVGMGRGQIRRMLLGESLLLTLVAVGVTLTVGTLCGYALSHMLYRMGAFYMAFRFPTGLALSYSGVLIIVPVFITLTIMNHFAKDALVERLRSMENG